MRGTSASTFVAVLALMVAECDGSRPKAEAPAPSATAASSDALAGVPPAVRDFLNGNAEHPFGQPGAGAPPENGFFAALVGVWACRLEFDDNGVVRSGFPATWAFKHSAGGYAIEHLYYQRKANLAPTLAAIGRDFHAVALVLYDPKIGAWRFVSASNLAGSPVAASTQVMTGRLQSPPRTVIVTCACLHRYR